jgi:hypothetical protein
MDSNEILGGYIDFPAKLMVYEGNLDGNGKKKYRLHINFSSHKVE